jgi:holo-[acyl-carrier protein] synthase
MPPRPFPFPLRVGTDIVGVHRVRAAMAREAVVKGEARKMLQPFLHKMLTARELKKFNSRYPDVANAEDQDRDQDAMAAAKHLAGRWAAKEAAIKASKPRKLTLLDVEILAQPTGEIYALIRDHTFVHKRSLIPEGDGVATAQGDAAADKENQDDPAGQVAVISISHENEYATAVCIAPFGPMPGDVGGEAEARMYDQAA